MLNLSSSSRLTRLISRLDSAKAWFHWTGQSATMRRDPAAILTAHLMDPDRRELYVEGPNDRTFLQWVTDEQRHPDACVLEISGVELSDNLEGGERARLLQFADMSIGKAKGLRFFADADADRLLGTPQPGNVWLTDCRDLEGYFLRVDCFGKVLVLAALRADVDPGDVLQEVMHHGKTLGLLRLHSEREHLRLPFRRTQLSRHVHADAGHLTVDLRAYVRALLQNARRSITETDAILGRTQALRDEFSQWPDYELVHGKDAVILFQQILDQYGGTKLDSAFRLLKCAFDRGCVPEYRVLSEVVSFLSDSSQPSQIGDNAVPC